MRETFKIMTFNILFGGGDASRFRCILDVIGKICPDILIMQECLDWERSGRLRQVAEIMNLPPESPHIYLGLARPRASGKRYHIAIASRFPMLNSVTHNAPAFLGHGIVQFEVLFQQLAITVFGTHFDAHSENLRFVEARYLRSLIEPESFAAGAYLLAGDLNALSRNDPYPANLPELLRQSGTTKYHLPPRFEVTEELEAYGWIDTLYYREKKPQQWITAARDRGGIPIPFRTDYIFASPRMARMLVATEVIEVDNASDHCPVVATFQIDN